MPTIWSPVATPGGWTNSAQACPAPGPLQRRRPDTDRLIAAVKAAGGTKVQGFHVATDHGWSDRRLTLQALVINWLAGL